MIDFSFEDLCHKCEQENEEDHSISKPKTPAKVETSVLKVKKTFGEDVQMES